MVTEKMQAWRTSPARRRWLKTALASLLGPSAIAGAAGTWPLPAFADRAVFDDVGLEARVAAAIETNEALRSSQGQLFISGARRGGQEHLAVILDEQASIIASFPLSERAHGAASHPESRRACLFARRPGLYLHAFDRLSPQDAIRIQPVTGRNFQGHGCYSESGGLLFATENDYEGRRGVLGVYDASTAYRRVGEIDTAGVGPHEVIRIPGTSLLVVANGGILTHPDSGRDKLDIDSMEPLISVLDARNGRLLARQALPAEWHQVSIRHLAVDSSGDVWFAGQYEGERDEVRGLAGRLSLSTLLATGGRQPCVTLVELPGSLQRRMSHYISSVAVCGERVLFTSSRGGLVFAVDRFNATVLETLSVRDCSGICAVSNRFRDQVQDQVQGRAQDEVQDGVQIQDQDQDQRRDRDIARYDSPADASVSALLSSGTGEILSLRPDELSSLALHPMQWDNHVYAI